MFSQESSPARIGYIDFVDQGKDDGYQQEYHSGSVHESRVLGDETFIDKILTHSESKPLRHISLEDIVQRVCLEYGIETKDLKAPGKYRIYSEARGSAAWLLLETGAATLAELSRFTDRDISTLSTAAKTIQTRANSDQALADRMTELKYSLQ
jgi:chromosomal replication initiation ATPase DnaA